MERQKHGFLYEQAVIEKYHLVKSNDYTAEWDAFSNSGIPVSIKLEKYGSDIEMADFFRNAKNTKSFYLVVGFWYEKKNNIRDEQIVLIPGDEWHNFFPEYFVEHFHNMLDDITNDSSDDDKWRHMMRGARKEWGDKTQNLVRPRFKRDHKTQKRIQCAINNKDFYDYFVKRYYQGGIV